MVPYLMLNVKSQKKETLHETLQPIWQLCVDLVHSLLTSSWPEKFCYTARNVGTHWSAQAVLPLTQLWHTLGHSAPCVQVSVLSHVWDSRETEQKHPNRSCWSFHLYLQLGYSLIIKLDQKISWLTYIMVVRVVEFSSRGYKIGTHCYFTRLNLKKMGPL